YNTSTGWMSMYFNTTGDYNVAYGPSALYYNTGGSYNVATGYGALIQNTTGSNNTACGSESLYSNTTADFNTACGAQALYSCTTGASNSAFGVSALWNNSSGYNNVAVGTGALSNNTTGYCNTALGRNAFSFNSAYYNSTAIGYNAQVTSENMVRVGDNAVTSIGGQVGWTAFSDGRFKQDVAENVPGLDFILKLRPVTYHYDMDALAEFYHTPDSLRIPESEAIAGRILHTGFIAQEVEKSALESGYDFSGVDKPNNSGDHYGLRYAEFTVPLVKSVQELNAENESLKSEIQMLKSEIAILKDENKTLTKDNNEITLRIEKIENQLSNK
ncbi:MAG: tail fiber domain-containing protein, partial [Bacteroidota bacterium]